MDEDTHKPKPQPSGNRLPPLRPPGVAIGLGPDWDGEEFDENARETITRPADGEGKFIRPSGGRGEYGHILVKVEPNVRGKGNVILHELPKGLISDNFAKAATEGILLALDSGVFVGRPMIDVIVRIVGGSFHETDSNDLAFKMAGIFALKNAVKEAGPIVIK